MTIDCVKFSLEEALFVYHALLAYPDLGLPEDTETVLDSAFEKVNKDVSNLIGFDPVCLWLGNSDFSSLLAAVKDETMKSEQEKPIVFSNPLMQHIGREVVVNDGEGNYTGWVVDVGSYRGMLLIDLGVQISEYTHNVSGTLVGGGTLRWFYLSNVKFVNEDGSLSDE